MKRYEFKIIQSEMQTFFPTERIKTKLQVINILMQATRYMLISPEFKNAKEEGKLILIVDKMSRLFFIKKEKYYSIVFPFFVSESESKLKFTFKDNLEIDSFIISSIISAIKCESLNGDCSLDFADSIFEFENLFEDFWSLFRNLLLTEDGYIRYDKDIERYNLAKSKGEEEKHPINHYDVFYSNKAAFKLGLTKDLQYDEFIDLLNIKTDCKFFKN